MTIKAFNKNNLQTIKQEVLAAIAEIAEKHSVEIGFTGGRYSPNEATLKMKFNTTSETGEVITKEAEALKLYYPDLVNKRFSRQGEWFRMIGYNTRASKNKAMFVSERDGKRYHSHIDYVIGASRAV